MEDWPGWQAGCQVQEYPLWIPSCLLTGLFHPVGITISEAVMVDYLCLITLCQSLEVTAVHVRVSLACLCFRRQSWHPLQALSLCGIAVL